MMHIEDDGSLDIIESTGSGVNRVNYYKALTVDSLAILKPKFISDEQMEFANEYAKNYIGHVYDNRFNLKDDNELSCVELVYRCLMKVNPNGLPKLNKRIKMNGNLSPQMFYDCGDFDVVYEIRS
jgi:uncharacterized protein YycO